MKKPTLSLPHTKRGILVTVLIMVALTATASATVFVYYYGTATATVRATDIRLVAGPDAGGSTYPYATVGIATTYDFATVTFSMFQSVQQNGTSPQPTTYFTNLIQIHNNNATASHTISLISISGVSASHPATGYDFGNVTVFYETTQTDSPTTGGAVGFLKMTSTAGGNVFSGTQTIAASGTQYLEVTAWAGKLATVGDTITFTINIKWV